MNLSRFATQNLRAILFVTLILCGIGAVVITTFPVSILPDVTFPRLVVIAKSGELPVKMMEAEISRPMEQTIATGTSQPPAASVPPRPRPRTPPISDDGLSLAWQKYSNAK